MIACQGTPDIIRVVGKVSTHSSRVKPGEVCNLAGSLFKGSHFYGFIPLILVCGTVPRLGLSYVS